MNRTIYVIKNEAGEFFRKRAWRNGDFTKEFQDAKIYTRKGGATARKNAFAAGKKLSHHRLAGGPVEVTIHPIVVEAP